MYYTYLARRKTLFAWLAIQGGLATFVTSQYLKPKSQLSALGRVYRLQQQNAQEHLPEMPALHDLVAPLRPASHSHKLHARLCACNILD
ncbi:hypothetical protein GGU10DRAFT_355162 [Lentinula aff. detonsa]|uniref:Uncharacterized protein n=1 Tax=Lentinula aff. detonsa TaxID=2804958 RepID=A0AA38KQA7_9AGAR|nr:hypothetical protein GGU10DRAFT_355162 [Lentinula aff. detonsa]